MRIKRVILRLRQISWYERFLLIEAVSMLGIARAALRILPFRCIAKGVGKIMSEPSRSENTMNQSASEQIGWALETSSRYTPWQSRCLVQAIAAKLMLRRRRIKSELYLGVAKRSDGELTAHAWLRASNQEITGGYMQDEYTVLAMFR